MAVRWWFKEHREPAGRARWTWRTVSVDGSIVVTSSEFKDFGVVVLDAIKGGFRPLTDHWIVETQFGTTHYKKGERAVIVPNDESAFDTRPPRPPLRPLKPRPSERKVPLSSVRKKLRENQEQ
jgi:hypothetical protein